MMDNVLIQFKTLKLKENINILENDLSAYHNLDKDKDITEFSNLYSKNKNNDIRDIMSKE